MEVDMALDYLKSITTDLKGEERVIFGLIGYTLNKALKQMTLPARYGHLVVRALRAEADLLEKGYEAMASHKQVVN